MHLPLLAGKRPHDGLLFVDLIRSRVDLNILAGEMKYCVTFLMEPVFGKCDTFETLRLI